MAMGEVTWKRCNGERWSESVGTVLPETIGGGALSMWKAGWGPRDGYHSNKGERTLLQRGDGMGAGSLQKLSGVQVIRTS